MLDEHRFYVYEWYIIGTDKVFYVGKGTGKRRFDISSRNPNFKRLHNDFETESRIVKDNMTEEEAEYLEAKHMLQRRLKWFIKTKNNDTTSFRFNNNRNLTSVKILLNDGYEKFAEEEITVKYALAKFEKSKKLTEVIYVEIDDMYKTNDVIKNLEVFINEPFTYQVVAPKSCFSGNVGLNIIIEKRIELDVAKLCQIVNVIFAVED